MSKAYSYTQTAGNMSLRRLNFEMNFSKTSKAIQDGIKSSAAQEIKQATKSGVADGQDRDTRKVTSMAAQVVTSEIMAVKDMTKSMSLPGQISDAKLDFDIGLTNDINNGTYARFEEAASKLNVRLKECEVRGFGVNADLKSVNIRNVAGEHADAYDAFARVSRYKIKQMRTEMFQNSKEIKEIADETADRVTELRLLNKQLAKDIRELKELNRYSKNMRDKLMRIDRFEKQATKLPKRSLKRFVRPTRLLLTPLRSSEVGQGIQMAEQIGMPLYMVGRRLVAAPINLALNAYVRFQWHRAASKLMAEKLKENIVISRHAAMKQIAKESTLKTTGLRGLFKTHPLITAQKNLIKAKLVGMRAGWYEAKALRAGVDTPAGIKAMAKANKLTAKAQYLNGSIGKDVFLKAIAEENRALRQGNIIGRQINKYIDFRDAAKRATKEAVKASWKALGETKFGKPFTKGVESIGKTFKVFGKIFQKIAEFMANVAMVLLGALLIAFMIILFLGGISLLCSFISDSNTTISRFATEDATQWEEYSQKLFTMLTDKHEKYVEDLTNQMESYNTADVQFPNGSQENYKELFAAVEIMCQYEPATILSYDEIEQIVSDMYDSSHCVIAAEYEYENNRKESHNSGTDQAAHIYLYILHDTALLYEEFQLVEVSGLTYGGTLCSAAMEAAPEDWIDVCTTVKQAIASTGHRYYGNDPTYCTIDVNGQKISVRPDCSGYVSACLALYEGCSTTTVSNGSIAGGYTSQTLCGSSIDGFEMFSWNGWENLERGDIIAATAAELKQITGKTHKYGHVEIFAGADNGVYYVWNCGSDASVMNSGKSSKSYSKYPWVYRPTSAGGNTSSVNTSTQNSTTTTSTTGSTSTISNTVQTVVDTTNIAKLETSDSAVGTSFWNSSNFTSSISNTADVVFDSKTGNEEGYEEALRTTMNSITISSYLSGNEDHATIQTTSDWVRAVFAEHGVMFCFDDIKMVYNGEAVGFSFNSRTKRIDNNDNFKAGDVMFYMPNTTIINGLKNTLNHKSFRTLDYTLLAKTFDLNGTTMTYEEIVSAGVVPLIYDGNGHWVSWCRDVNSSAYSTLTPSLQSYATSSLDVTRIITVNRYYGFTVEPIYGSTTYFEGWTDYHVAELLEIINNDCWETGEAAFYMSDGSKVTGLFSSDDLPDTIDYSWYHEDIFTEDTLWINSDTEHVTETSDDLISVFIRNYDRWGVLPSAGVSYAMAVTYNRSTEESLKYFNIFGIEKNDTNEVEKYSYDDSGNANLWTEEYEQYTSYTSAYNAWTVGKTITPGLYEAEVEAGTAFYSQYNELSRLGLLKSGSPVGIDSTYIELMQSYYASNSATLIEADKIAMKRYKLIIELKSTNQKWEDYWKNSPYKDYDYSELKTECTQDELDSMYGKAKDLYDAIKALQDFESTETDYAYVTIKETNALKTAIENLETAYTAIDEAEIYQETPCPGHKDKNGKLQACTDPNCSNIKKEMVAADPTGGNNISTDGMSDTLEIAKSHEDYNYKK